MDNWTILNMKKRVDRRYISVMQATMLGVPPENIRIWEAMDAEDYGNDVNSVIDACVGDGFPELERLRSVYHENRNLGVVCQLWNVCRYLRELTETRKIEMFIHDGVVVNLHRGFTPNYGWFGMIADDLRVITKVQFNTNFKLLTCSLLSQLWIRFPV